MTISLFPKPDTRHPHGTCPCGATGRLWRLKGQLVCNACYRVDEERIAREVAARPRKAKRK